MKHLALILLICLSFATACGQPVAAWLETCHDFGTFHEQDGKVTCQLRVVNTGNADLLILRVKPSCGCTASEFTRTPIVAGDTGIVTLTYNPKGRPGEFEKDAFVYTNGEPARERLQIKGNVIPNLETLEDQFPVKAGAIVYNGRTLPLGEVPRGRGRMTYMSGYNASTDSIVVTADNVPRHISVSAVPDTVPPGSSSTVTVYFDSKKAPLWGLNSDSFTLFTSPLNVDSGEPSGFTQVEVMAVVTEDFSLLTDKERDRAPEAVVSCGERLNFDAVTQGETMQQTFTITNRGKDRLHVRRLWSGSQGVSASTDRQEMKRGKSATVTVTVDTSVYKEPLLNALLTVMTDDPVQPSRTIRLVGEIKTQN